jgi:hypothetical protein
LASPFAESPEARRESFSPQKNSSDPDPDASQ